MLGWFRPVQFTRGDDCLTCYGAGATPLHYYVMFVGIEKGDNWILGDGEPPNGLYDITQHPVNPCSWFLVVVGGVRVYYTTEPGQTILQLIYRHPLFAFVSNNPVACSRWHANDLNNPAGVHFWGGFGYVFTPTEAQRLIESVTPVVDPDPLLHVAPMANGIIVVSYTDEWGDTKFKIKVDTTA